MLLDACSPDWGFIERFYEDIKDKFYEGSWSLVERTLLREWLLALLAFFAGAHRMYHSSRS